MRFTRWQPLLLLVLGTASVVGCGKGGQQLPPPEPPTVAVIKPKLTPLQPTKEFTGRLVTKDPVKVLPQIAGRVLSREFKDGDYVEEGKILYYIDPVLYKAEVEKAKADIAKAKADMANWTAQAERDRIELARVKKLPKSVSESDVEKVDASVKVDEAQRDVAKANKEAGEAALTKAEENLKYCTIYAPATGRVGQALVFAGALVDAYKTEMVSVYPIDPIYAVFEVDELTSLWYREQIRSGAIADPRNPATPASCTIKLKDEKNFSTDKSDRSRHSFLDYIDPEIVRATGTRTIRATFPNSPKRGPKGEFLSAPLSAGDSVRVRVDSGSRRPVLAIPESVIFSQQRKQYVYVVVDGKAQLREIEPGEAFDGMVEIKSGLKESDTVVADNLLRVRPGIPVTVK
jgi:RND family efflux transporter MFP subunit